MTPLLRATLGLAGGLLFGLRLPLPALLIGAAAVATAILALDSRGRVLPLFLLAGMVSGWFRADVAARDCRELLTDGDTLRLVGAPRTLTTPGAPLLFDAVLLSGAGAGAGAGAGGQPPSCGGTVVRLRVTPRHEALFDSVALGALPLLAVQGTWLAYPRRNGWPRRSEYAGALVVAHAGPAARGAIARDAMARAGGEPAPQTSAQRAPQSSAPAWSARAGAVTRFRAARQAHLRALLPERWGLAESLLLAQRGGLTPDVREQWVAAGLVHMLAISGMHVGLIAAGVLGIARLLRVPPRRARRAALLVTAAYVLFLGAPSAALRALLQAALLLVSVELQRPAEPFTALAAAAFVILVLEPMSIIDPGFQLSFAGMIGLIGWRRPVGDLLPRVLPGTVRDGLAAGIAASALTTPVAALHFGTASWIGIPASVVAAPLLGAAVGALVAALAIAAVTGAVSGLHAIAADVPLRLLELVAEWSARVPGGHGLVSPQRVLVVLGAVALVIVVRRALERGEPVLPPSSHAPDVEHVRWAQRRRRARLRTAGGIAAALAVVSWTPLLLRPRDGRMEIHAIDVGQGDAYAIRTPGNRWILVDTGPRTLSRDAGRDRVVPYLMKHGVRTLHALILTHPDGDHIGGAAAVLDVFPADLIIDPGLPAGKDMFIDLLASAHRRGQRWIAARDGVSFDVDGVHIALMYPLPVLDASDDANDHSVVFRLAYGSFSALFTGDAPDEVEDGLAARLGDSLRVTLLKVGHHGSRTSTGETLLRTARPEMAVISSGRGNRYGHPAPDVVARLRRHGVRVLRTDELGNITFRAWHDGRTEVLAN